MAEIKLPNSAQVEITNTRLKNDLKVMPKSRFVQSPKRPTITRKETLTITNDMRPIIVDDQYVWGNRKSSNLSLMRATKSDLSDATVVATLAGGFVNTWRNLIRVKPGRLVAYVISSDSAQAGFYTIDDSNPASITYTRRHGAFPAGDCDPALQTLATSDDGKYVWACSYGTKNESNPLYYIYRSTDYGETWAEVYTHITNLNVHMHCIAWDSWRNRIWACVGDFGTGGRPGILYSDDFGATGTWTFIEDTSNVYENSHMHIAIIPMPDKVLFGTDRTPAGFVVWRPENPKDIKEEPTLSTLIQEVFMQKGGLNLWNLGFAGKPYYDFSSYPYKILVPFGNVESYSQAWLWNSYDGEHWELCDWVRNPSTDRAWIKSISGIMPDGTVIANGLLLTGDEYIHFFTYPEWKNQQIESENSLLVGSEIPKTQPIPTVRTPQYELSTIANAVSVVAGGNTGHINLGLDGTEDEVWIWVNIDKQPWTLVASNLAGFQASASGTYPVFSANTNMFANITIPATALLLGVLPGLSTSGITAPTTMQEAKAIRLPYDPAQTCRVANGHATDTATVTIRVLRVWR